MEPHFNSGIRNIRSYAVKTGDKTKTGSEGFEPYYYRGSSNSYMTAKDLEIDAEKY